MLVNEMNDCVMERDCMEFMRSHDGRFDLILADPPYAHGMDFGNKSDAKDIPKWADWMEEWMRLALTKLHPGGCMYVYGWNENMCYVMHRFPHGSFRYLQWWRLNGQIKPTNWVRSHECIVQIWPAGSKPSMLLDNMREPYTEPDRAGSKDLSNCNSPYARMGSQKIKFREYHPEGRYGTDVLYASVVRSTADNGTPDGGGYCYDCKRLFGGKEGPDHWGHDVLRHPTQKPMSLSERLIISKCEPNGSQELYIPFAGSGAECVMAFRLGVRFWSTEITPEYVELGNMRLDWERRRREFDKPENFELGANFNG